MQFKITVEVAFVTDKKICYCKDILLGILPNKDDVLNLNAEKGCFSSKVSSRELDESRPDHLTLRCTIDYGYHSEENMLKIEQFLEDDKSWSLSYL